MTETVYLVVEPEGYDGGSTTTRVYTDRAEAEVFIEAYNQSGGFAELEEMPLGPPPVEYDGPIYVSTWTTRRKLRGEKQLVIVGADGLTTVAPSAVPAGSAGSFQYYEMFAGPTWRDVATAPDYEEPAVWIDNFHQRQEWHTGDKPPAAEIQTQAAELVIVRGSDRAAVDQMCRNVAAIEAMAVRGPL